MIRFTLMLAVTVGAIALLPGRLGAGEKQSQLSISFEDGETGKRPDDFSFDVTGKGRPGSWVIMEDAATPNRTKVLAQTSTDTTDSRFPLCIYKKLTVKDVDVAVRFKAVSGKVDQAAGLVVRLRNEDNYYVVRANALEDNVRLYKVKSGKREEIAGARIKVSSGDWHTLELNVSGPHFQVFFDAKLLFEADDWTFKKAGKVGVWTKADSVTYFDDLLVITR